MKSHVLLIGRVLEDLSIRCCVSTTRDLKRIASRVEKEGDSFLTITLPELAEYLEFGLSEGRLYSDQDVSEGGDVDIDVSNSISHSTLVGWKLQKGTRLPVFLHRVWAQVFDAKTGVLLDNPNPDAIQGLRQVCNLYKKILHPCSDAKVKAAFDRYVECDNQVRQHDNDPQMLASLCDFNRIAMLVLGDVLTAADREVWAGDIVPKHGPGATADFRKANAKYDNKLWTTRLEELFFAGDFLYPSWSHFCEDKMGPIWLEPEAEIPVRVVSVPKTQKTPRIIAIEPTHMQYVQQGIAEVLVKECENHDLVKHFIGFSDQEYSRTLAREGSRTGLLATLDLSEASDRVSTLHVRSLLANTPWLSQGVAACRSRKAEVPGHGVIPIAKYASMGSALTFPLEAMVFLTIVLLGIEKELNHQLTIKDLKVLVGRVRVYGDDIVVPVEYAKSVRWTLEDFGLSVNGSKSFETGKFRESCGGDYYDGVDVGYVKVRRNLPSARSHVREIISAVETRNLFYERGYWRTAEFLDRLLEELIPFPRVGPDSPGLGRHSFLGYDVERECPYLQRPLVRAAVVQSKIPDSDVSGQGALLKFFLKRSDEPTADKRHLERAGRPVSVNIKTRWVASY